MFRSHNSISREGWYYLTVITLVFAGAIFKEVNLLLMLGGLMLGPLLFNWRAVKFTLDNLELQRKVPPAVCAGDPLTVGLRLINKRKQFGSWAVTVEEQIIRLCEPEHNHSLWNLGTREKPLKTTVFFPYVPAGQDRIGTYRGKLFERGKYRLGPVKISTRFPFGLFNRTLGLLKEDTLYVFPRLGRLTPNWLARHRRALAGEDRRERQPGPEGDFYGVREWRSGDGMKYIHWRSSARTGKLVVRQFERPRNRDVAIILDLWRSEKPTDIQRENVELAVSFAATVLSDLCRRGGSQLHLATFNAKPHCLGGPASAALMQDMLRILATIESRSEDHLPDLADYALGQISSGAEIILVSTRPVDLDDDARFRALLSDPHRAANLHRIRCIDASSQELEQLFVAEEEK
jgi:uncharacterized protein (DUF58 family)